MKKFLILLFSCFSFAFSSNAQFTYGIDLSDTSQYFIGYLTGSRLDHTRDIYYKEHYYQRVLFSRLDSSHNDGNPTRMVHVDNKGNLKVSPYSAGTSVNLTAGNRISITGTYPNLTISYIEPTVHYPTRSFNSNFTISNTLGAYVFYTIQLDVTNATAIGGASANVYLETSSDAGTTWTLANQGGNASTTAVAVTVSLKNTQIGFVGGYIAPGLLVRLRTATTNTGLLTPVPTLSLIKSQETY